MATTDWARIYPRGSRTRRRYWNPNLDADYLARTAGVYGTTAFSDPLVVISPTPNPPAPATPTTPAPPVPDISFILAIDSRETGHFRSVLSFDVAGGGTEVLQIE